MIIKFRKRAPKEPEISINVVLLPFQGVISNCFYTQGVLAPLCYASVPLGRAIRSKNPCIIAAPYQGALNAPRCYASVP